MAMRAIVMLARLLPTALLTASTGCGFAGSFAERDDRPEAPPPAAPAGWKALTGGRFGYLVRQNWTLKVSGDIGGSSLYLDDTGRWRMKVDEYSGCGDPDRPDRLASFAKRVDPYETLQTYADDTGPSRLAIPGSGRGWRYELTGGTGRHYTVFNVWTSSKRHPCWGELWMTVPDDRGTADVIATHFTAAPPPP